MMDSNTEATQRLYKEAAEEPMEGLCCTTNPVWELPGLNIPSRMKEMNYGCGTTVHSRDLSGSPRVLYAGVGGGMELLQFAYFSQGKGSVIGIDPVDEMLDTCRENLEEAKKENPWFDPTTVELKKGDVLNVPVEDGSIDVAAQNCLFNIFHEAELERSIHEMYRLLAPHGRLVLSDPVCEEKIPEKLRNDERLRAMCLTGAIPLQDYIERLTDAGFGTIEVRAKRPYRILAPQQYDVESSILVESVEVCAIKDPMPSDGPCVFTGRTAIYHGTGASFDDGKGHTLLPNQPLAVCDKTAKDLEELGRDDIYVSGPTYFYDGGGCC